MVRFSTRAPASQCYHLELKSDLSFTHHHLDKVFKINLTVIVAVYLSVQVIQFLITHLFTILFHNFSHLNFRDGVVFVFASKLFECFYQFLINHVLKHFFSHQRDELIEIELWLLVLVNVGVKLLLNSNHLL